MNCERRKRKRLDRRKISFDCDGVLATGGYTPPEDRTNKTYFAKQIPNPEIIPTIHWLSIFYDIYVISTRGHEKANLGLRAWLHHAVGCQADVETFAGVITFPANSDELENVNAPMDKAGIIHSLGISVHVDDDPMHVEALGDRGILMPSDMPSSQAAVGRVPTVATWDNLREFLTTPGMIVYGRNGAKVHSPALMQGVYPRAMVEQEGLVL